MTAIWLDGERPTPPRIDRADVRVDTMRGTGPGGQHRNKTDSGVRLTHRPTGIVVTATEDRSQHVNREVAWARLEARLSGIASATAHDQTNRQRQETLGEFRSWTWCGWRDEVKGPGGVRGSMSRVLSGRLQSIL